MPQIMRRCPVIYNPAIRQIYTKERGCQWLFHSIGVDTRRSKGEKETEDHLRRTVEKERNKAEWKSWNVAKVAAQNRK